MHLLTLDRLKYYSALTMHTQYSESLFTFHKIFLSQMRGSIVLPHPNFGQLLLRFISHLSLYADFVKSQDHSSKVLNSH